MAKGKLILLGVFLVAFLVLGSFLVQASCFRVWHYEDDCYRYDWKCYRYGYYYPYRYSRYCLSRYYGYSSYRYYPGYIPNYW